MIKNECLWLSLCSQNAILLEEKEKREKEMRLKIIEEAEEYKVAFYEKRKVNVESSKVQNREREKVSYTCMKTSSLADVFFPVLIENEICLSSSYSWLIKRNFTKRQTKLIGKQLQSSFLVKFPTLKRKGAKRIRTRSHQLQSFKAQSLGNPRTWLGCGKYC